MSKEDASDGSEPGGNSGPPAENDADAVSLLELQRRAAVAELMAGTVHDSRNIMTGVLSFAQIGQRRVSDPKARELFDEIAGETLRCVDLIDQVLQLLRGKALNGDAPVAVPLLPVIRSAHSLVAGEARLKRTRIEVDVPAGLRCWGIERSLLQVLLNLLINAVQATPLDGEIRVCAAESGDMIEVRVSDSGAGVPLPLRDQVFQSFFSTKGVSGTGLGLSMSRFLARQLGGDLVLEASTKSAGASFCLTVPRVPSPEPGEVSETGAEP